MRKKKWRKGNATTTPTRDVIQGCRLPMCWNLAMGAWFDSPVKLAKVWKNPPCLPGKMWLFHGYLSLLGGYLHTKYIKYPKNPKNLRFGSRLLSTQLITSGHRVGEALHGFGDRFLKSGSLMDLFRSIRCDGQKTVKMRGLLVVGKWVYQHLLNGC